MKSRPLRRTGLAVLTALLLLVPTSQALGFERLGQYGVGYPGTEGAGMILPKGIAVSPSGQLGVTDQVVSRVLAFSQGGSFLQATGKNVNGFGAGTCVTDCLAGESGAASGQLSSPWGAAAGADEYYVAELGNSRVSVFGYDGQFRRAFGADVGGPGANLCTTACGPGTPGLAAGQLATPAAIAVDASGLVYVGSFGSSRVDVFDPRSGQFLRAFGKGVGGPGIDTCTTSCFPGVNDGTPGSLNIPSGLAISTAGDVYVVELGASRVSVFNQAGGFLRTFSGPGTGAGQLAQPMGIALDGRGNVFVADSENHRLAVFGEGGDFRGAYGKDVVPGGSVGAEFCSAVCKAGVEGFGAGAFTQPGAVATDCRGAVYVGTVGRVDKWGEAGSRVPPCPSNAFSIGKVAKNKKRGTLTVDVTVSGPGALAASVPAKLRAAVPQPVTAGTVRVTLRAAGKGVKALNKKGRLKGRLTLTFTPPNGDPNTQSRTVQLAKRLKKKKKARKRGKGKGGKPKGGKRR